MDVVSHSFLAAKLASQPARGQLTAPTWKVSICDVVTTLVLAAMSPQCQPSPDSTVLHGNNKKSDLMVSTTRRHCGVLPPKFPLLVPAKQSQLRGLIQLPH